jgi:hypothetical protein
MPYERHEARASQADHPISLEQARTLLAGALGNFYRAILRACCAPIYWFDLEDTQARILNNCTLTFVQTPDRLIGITAAHVIRGYLSDYNTHKIALQVFDALVEYLDIIDISDENDIATISVDNELLDKIGKEIVPLTCWPPREPQEGRGIMLAGYPGVDRIVPEHLEVDWGLFTALGVARRVTETQITWLVERDHVVKADVIPTLPPHRTLGGISGGPLIAFFETSNFLSYYVIAAIVSQAHEGLEYVVAKRADCIRADGTIERRNGVRHQT